MFSLDDRSGCKPHTSGNLACFDRALLWQSGFPQLCKLHSSVVPHYAALIYVSYGCILALIVPFLDRHSERTKLYTMS